MSSRNIYLAAGFACMTAAIFGVSIGYIGGILVLPSFMHHFHQDDLPESDLASIRSIIVSSWIFGGLAGALGAMPICARFGRKVCLNLSGTVFVVGTVLQLVPPDAPIPVFDVGRLLNGIGVGSGTVAAPIYIAEISGAAERGMLMSGFQVAIQLCALIGFWAAYATHAIFPDSSNMQWRIPVAIQLIPGVLLMFGSFYIPESPLWLTEQAALEEAKKSLSWLRREKRPSAQTVSDLNTFRNAVIGRALLENLPLRPNTLEELLRKPNRKRLHVGIGLMAFNSLSGTNALNFYAPAIFMSAGFTSVSASLFLTGLFGLTKLVASLAFMFSFVRVWGNRFWLLLGSAICTAAFFVLAYCVSVLNDTDATVEDGVTLVGITACLMVFVFAFFFTTGLGPIAWNVCSEIFPTHLNTTCCTITTCTQWICQVINAMATPYLLANVGPVNTYLIFGGINAFSLIWSALCVPETRGVELGKDMDAIFDKDTKEDGDTISESEDVVDEETPLLMTERTRRRSSIAIQV